MKELSSSIVAFERSGIRQVMDLAFRRGDVVRLEVGDPDFATAPHIVEAAAAAARSGYTHYTPSRGLGEVREAMATKISTFNGIEVGADDVVVSAGGGHGMFALLRGMCDPGDIILAPDPGWPNYRTVAALCGVEIVPYPLMRDSGFLPDLDRLEELAGSLRGAKAIVLNSPANPTGAVWPHETIEAALGICQKNDLYLISDECYEAIVYEGEHVSPATMDPDGRTISMFTVSKTYAMTGWRVGYLTGPQEVVDVVGKVVESSVSCAAAISQKAAEAALTGDQGWVADMVDAYRSRRDLAVELLEEAGLGPSRPHGAFYVMAEVPAQDTLDFAKRLVEEAGVAVAPGETFGESGRGMVRLSLAASRETISEGIRLLSEFSQKEATR